MKLLYLIIIFSWFNFVSSRIHKLELHDDTRKFIALSTFGFYKNGYLLVNLTRFEPNPFKDDHVFGFSLDRASSDEMKPDMDTYQEKCLLHTKNDRPDSIYLTMDLKRNLLNVTCNGQKFVIITNETSQLQASQHIAGERSLAKLSRDLQRKTKPEGCSNSNISINVNRVGDEGNISLQFLMIVTDSLFEGLYSLYFHSCPNYNIKDQVKMTMVVDIEEKNPQNFLSAGEMPLPALYSMMAVLFFLSGCFWVFLLRKTKHVVFKIHYLMSVLVFLKSFSLLFHGINYYFIEQQGEHIATWAILYYITHLLKGSVLFIVIILVGTGWIFVKPILSEKDRNIFMLVIPLQLLTAVADIILEESEEGDSEQQMWRRIFILVDLICCGAILFPVVWSIRHLQEASETDGKAAINLRKLKLFQQFYLMVVCYIYFTRIIVYLLRMTVPFQYEWLDEMFKEMATYVFYVMTGYKFRPTPANPYFDLQNQDDDEEMDVAITQSGITEGLKKLNRAEYKDTVENDEEIEIMINRHESSHEYD